MCGIAGLMGTFEKSIGEESTKKMLKEIIHRGPDSNGVWSTDNFSFGMQRLSIVDLQSGEQPIWIDSGIGIVFNGEIYNHKEIRSSLEKKGIVFNTNSDTEVISQLYSKNGINAIHELEGMFSICIYDPNINKSYIIRDRMGIKPLYYSSYKENLFFASEIKSIISVNGEKNIDNQSVWNYLSLRYVPSPNTIWKNIHKLEPGHYIEYDLSENLFSIHKYWSFDFKSEKRKNDRNYEKEFENLFLESVDKRLVSSDVPVGILLSGGLDSSCVAAAASELGHKNFHTFSIGFDDGGNFSELKYAREVANHIGSNHHEIVIGKNEFLGFMDDFVKYSDEPLADLASIPLYFVSKLASKHVKVVLSGEGADEILAGYNFDCTAKKFFYLKMLSYLPKCILEKIPYDSLKSLASSGFNDFLKYNATHITNVFSEDEKKLFCSFDADESTKDYIQSLYHTSSSKNPLDQLQQVYCKSWLVEDLLMKADKMSMANSLELRVPFLDHKLVEWASKVPMEYKVGSFFRGFTTKKILRTFAKGRIPEKIINRPKQGFPVPAYKWLSNGEIDSFVNNSFNMIKYNKLFKREEIFKIINYNYKSNDNNHKIWNLIILARWINKWIK